VSQTLIYYPNFYDRSLKINYRNLGPKTSNMTDIHVYFSK